MLFEELCKVKDKMGSTIIVSAVSGTKFVSTGTTEMVSKSDWPPFVSSFLCLPVHIFLFCKYLLSDSVLQFFFKKKTSMFECGLYIRREQNRHVLQSPERYLKIYIQPMHYDFSGTNYLFNREGILS